MKIQRSCRRLLLPVLLITLSLFTFRSMAQDATGRVVGVVSDPTGSVIPKVKVTAINVATNVTVDTLSNNDGSYQIPLLPIGSYRVSAEAVGFRKVLTEALKLDINQSLKVDLKLEVGSVTETVQVESSATGVETISATTGSVVNATTIHEAPLNGRNVMSLALLAPGVIPQTSTNLVAGGTGFSIAGQRTDSMTFLLDGGLNTNLLNNGLVLNPNPEAIEEFRVLTSNYNAEYGRNAGGIISVVTRAGGNQFHGALYDFVRNSDFNANSFFNNQVGLQRDSTKRNQFGATIGGPVLIPKVFNGRNKLFFMISYQGQRLTQNQTSAKVNTFTPAELQGDFSHSNSAGNGPDANVVSYLQQFPYFQPNPALAARGIIDPTRINPVAQNYIKAGLIPTAPSGFLFSQSGFADNRDELTERIDFNITQSDHLSATLGSNRNPQTSPFTYANVPGFPSSTLANRYLGSVNYTKTITPRLLNEFRFTAQRNHILQAVPAGKASTPNQLGVGIISDDPHGPTNLNFTSLQAGYSVQGPTALIDNTYTWSDVLTWNRGTHNFKGGFSYTPYQNNTAYDFYVNGEFSFYGTGGGSFSQNDRADFLLGLPDEYLQFGRAPSNIRTHNIAGFFQDEWKVRRNLTLTLGIRYEYSSPKIDLQGRSFSLGLGQQSTVFSGAPKGLLFPGDANAPKGSNFPDKNDWAPRLGFAWDPKGDGKMSIRGGGGVFFDILKGEDNLQFNGQAPFFGAADLFFDPLSANPTKPSNYLSDPYGATGQPNPFPSRPPAPNINFNDAGFLPFGGGGVFFVDPHLRTPYIYQYNLSVQREIMHDTTLEVSYIGSSSHKLTGLVDANPFLPGTKTRRFNAQPGGSSSAFSYLDLFANVGSAHYNSMAIGIAKRMSDTRFLGNIQYQISYTYGHSIDNESGFRSRDGRVPAYDRNRFRASSDFDLTHYVAISGAWELPFAKAWTTGPKALTRGWELFPIITYRSGQTLDVFAGLSRSRTSVGPSGVGDPNLVRANLINQVTFFNPQGQQVLKGRTGNFFFDPTAFAAPVTNAAVPTYGTLGRNAFRAPDRANFDIAVSKSVFVYKEAARFEIRADCFNCLNHTEFGAPSTSINSAVFGQISTTAEPRIIQLAGRFIF